MATGLSPASIRKDARLQLGGWRTKDGVTHHARYDWYK